MPNDASQSRIDARPVRPFSDLTLWAEAVARREAFAERVRRTLAAAEVDALVFVSEEGVYPPWLRMEAWTPAAHTSASTRAHLAITVDARPYRETPIVVSAELVRGARKFVASEWPDFTEDDVADWTRCALSLSNLPNKHHPFLDGLRTLVASVLPFLSKPHANRVDRRYRPTFLASFIVATAWLGLAAASLVAIANLSLDNGAGSFLLFVVAAAVAIGLGLWLRRRARPEKRAVAVAPQPLFDPRSTGLVDSWHAVIAGLGADYDEIRKRLIASLPSNGSDLVCREETYGRRVPNGFELRTRFVVSRHQAYVYVHFHRFGNDMFVGWQAFLNWAQWGETAPVSEKVEQDRPIEFRELRQASYVPSHIDIVELNALSERVHRKLERELKAILKEKSIDQEIDFKVIRGDRERALGGAQKAGEKPKRRGALRFAGFGERSGA